MPGKQAPVLQYAAAGKTIRPSLGDRAPKTGQHLQEGLCLGGKKKSSVIRDSRSDRGRTGH